MADVVPVAAGGPVHNEPAPVNNGNAPPQSPDEKALAQKKQDLDKAKADADSANARATSLSTDIKALEARVTEVQKANDAYAASAPKLTADLTQTASDIKTKLAMASAATKDKQPAIEQAVKSVDDDLAAQQQKLQQLQQTSDKAQQDAAQAGATMQVKQSALNDIKLAAKGTDDQIKQVKALQDQAVKAEGQGDFVSMYFLLTEASTLQKSIVIATPQAYAQKLAAAQADAESAKADAAAKKADADKQAANLAEAGKQLQTATAARRTTIMDSLKKIGAVVAA